MISAIEKKPGSQVLQVSLVPLFLTLSLLCQSDKSSTHKYKANGEETTLVTSHNLLINLELQEKLSRDWRLTFLDIYSITSPWLVLMITSRRDYLPDLESGTSLTLLLYWSLQVLHQLLPFLSITSEPEPSNFTNRLIEIELTSLEFVKEWSRQLRQNHILCPFGLDIIPTILKCSSMQLWLLE